MGGQIEFQVMNALAATAAAWAAGVNPAMIVRGLTTFQTDYNMMPGRFNVQEFSGIQVVTDYGHNPAAIKALAKSVGALGKRHTVTIFTLPGDRRDEDLIASTLATIPFSDRYILHDSTDRRERAVNEVPELMRKYLPANVPTEIVAGQVEALHRAWQILSPGDRLVVIVDKPKETHEALLALTSSDDGPGVCMSPIDDTEHTNGSRIEHNGIISTAARLGR
jgi:cyanophycin synthetase